MYDFINMLGEHTALRNYRKLVVGAATGCVLEIGAGTGANLPYYLNAESIVATDPDQFMLRRAERRANRMGLSIEFHRCPAEDLPFPDASFDTVVVTLALCTVEDPSRALEEVKRVLKPGGYLRFIEHVQADGRFHRRVQNILAPLWRWLGAGCHLDRRTASVIQSAGFEMTKLIRRSAPITPLIIGEARLRNY
jgi:ubiquinone/menaquinone biosynthesis C-methylase UbiE